MNASQFMDKQIMELSASGAQSGDLLDLLNPSEKHRSNGDAPGAGINKEEVLPSYDFQPIRSVGSSPSLTAVDGGRAWGSADSAHTSSNIREQSYSSSEAPDSYKVIPGKTKEAYDTNVLAEFDRTVKKYADNLMQALEGVNSRLSQLEERTHKIENTFDDLKLIISTHNGSNDGKLRQLENILREVQTCVQVLRDKQEIAEAQVHLASLQASKADHQQPDESAVIPSLPGQKPPPPSQPSLPPQGMLPPQFPALLAPPPPQGGLQSQLPVPSALPLPPPPVPQGVVPSQLPAPLALAPPPPPHRPQTQFPSVPAMPPQEPYYFHPSQPQPEPPQHQRPLSQFQSSPQPQQYTQNAPPPHLQAPLFPHHPEESSPYVSTPPQIYPPNARPFSGPSSGPQFSTGPGLSESYPHGGSSPSHYNSAMKQPPFFSSSGGPGNSSYPRLPTAHLLPAQAVPVGSGSGGERVPIDDVVDKVTSMGFPRDVVRSTVRTLTENGQNVDLNVVLDKLMNGGENQPQKGWFGR